MRPSKPWTVLLLVASLIGPRPAWAGAPHVHHDPRDKCNADADVDRLGTGKGDDLHGCFATVAHPHPVHRAAPHHHGSAHIHHAHHR